MLIAHISDLHILKNPDPAAAPLLDNASRLRKTIEALCSLHPAPDVVVITGDISHEGTADDYSFCRSLLEELPCPYLLIPGNHDDRVLMREVFPVDRAGSDPNFYHFVHDSLPVRIIGIDTLKPGMVTGEICVARREWIGKALRQSEKPVAILMHHPPYPFGLIDNPEMQCSIGTSEFDEMIRKSGNVEAILCGHLHVMTSATWAGVTALSAPSVAPAFLLDIEKGQVSGWCNSSPAFALHFFRQGRGMTTHVIRIEDQDSSKPLG
jgi:3',5'-cyclic AMP phosphodiesterase CpdA